VEKSANLQGATPRQRAGGRFARRVGAIAAMLLAMLLATPAQAEVGLPEFQGPDQIVVSAEAANRWQQGGYEVWVLRGNCLIVQGATTVRSQEAVLWIDHAEAVSRQRSKVIAYLEGNVTIDSRQPAKPARLADRVWFGRFFTTAHVEVHAGVVAGQPDVLPAIYQRGMDRRNPTAADVVRSSRVEQAAFTTPPPVQPVVGRPLPPGTRRVRVFPRGDVPVQAQWIPDQQTDQWVAIIESGVNFIVDGVQGFGSIDVSADRMVIWTRSQGEPDLKGQTPQDQRQPLEIYMEGNVVFRQGERTIYASRMYYDVPNQIGTVLDAEVLTPMPKYDGMVRLHAKILQETSPEHFVGQDGFFTPSRLGVPGIRMQSTDITFDDVQHPVVDPFTGQPAINPKTNEPAVDHERLVTASNDFIYLEDVPIFYFPYFATDLNDPSFILRRIQFDHNSIFGYQIRADFNAFQLLGIKKPPPGTDWGVSLDYLSARGFGYGTTFLYKEDNLFGIPGHTSGLVDYFGISDRGYDDLGADRSHLQPEATYRDRLLIQHRQDLPDGFQLTLEGGETSDRNFLQQYFKREWDEFKDESTDADLKQTRDNWSWDVFASVRTDDFVSQTQWLPKADHFLMGQSLFGDNLTWYEHSSVGYADFQRLSPPSNPNDQPFSFLPWEVGNRQGDRVLSRQELDWPIQLGPVKVVPYVLGELGNWGEDINGQSLDIAYGQIGVRADMPMWRADPTVQSDFWNVHGIAHKVDFMADFSASESNHNMTDLPMYDSLDDWSVEEWRRRYATLTYGWPSTIPPTVAILPFQVDPRDYALRMGMGDWVSAPDMEIADDMEALRLGIHQIWQTKRGPPDNLHIVDWIEFDTDVTVFPDPSRDDFGQTFGLADYYFRWHVGDRLTLLSDGMFDFFNLGQKEVTIGAFLDRPPRGSLYVGVRALEGPITQEVFTMTYNYLMSPKWMSSYSFSVNWGDTRGVGQLMRITRIGESLLISAGFSYDIATNVWGADISIEPRFLNKGKLGDIGGTHIPPAGATGLE
jgi:hypothetical protein